MTTLELTPERIKADIAGYQSRLRKAELKLISLPVTSPTSKERKKLKSKRLKLQKEIEHISTLISYAQQALKEATN